MTEEDSHDYNEYEVRSLIKSGNGGKGIDVVRVETEDLNGVSRGFNIDAEHFLGSVIKNGHGIPKGIYSFETNKVEIIEDTGVLHEVNYGNCCMYPDLATFRVLPWEPSIASVIATIRLEGGDPFSPLFSVSPRNICKVQLQKLKDIGFQLYSAFEFEFYLLSETTHESVSQELNAFSTHSQTKFLPFTKEIFKGMKGMGIRPEVHHSECGPGQQEFTCSPEEGIAAADNAFRLKHLVKEVAAQHEMLATFMSLPFQNEPGSSGHYNHSLRNLKWECVMYNPEGRFGFSETAEHWLAGLMHHSSALMALAAPFGNCYERVSPDMNFAPSTNRWGYDDRTVAFRIKNKNTPNMYIENRMAGGAVNPYLLVAGSIIAGMDGLKRKLRLPDPSEEGSTEGEDSTSGVENLPSTLAASLEALLNNDLFVRELGSEFVKCFSATRRAEVQSVEKARGSKDEVDFFRWYRNSYAKYI